MKRGTGAVLLLCSTAWPALAATNVALTPAAGHPDVTTTVKGSGFGASEAVDIYVDTTDTLLMVTTSTGTFSGSVTIPANAQPGKHYITAVGRRSGDAAQASFNVATNWQQFAFGQQHLSANPWENTLSPATVPSLGTLWAVTPSTGETGITPSVSGTRVYSSGNGVSCVSAATGATLWTALSGDTSYGTPSVSGKNLYVATLSGVVAALNATSGAIVWSVNLGANFESGASVAGGQVIVASEGGTVYALSATTGATLWSNAISGAGFYSQPTVAGNLVFIGSGLSDGTIYALNATTGAQVWSYKTGASVQDTPAVANGTVFVGNESGGMYALQTATGNLAWSQTLTGGITGSPAVANGLVYVPAANVYALQTSNGATVWSAPVRNYATSITVANGVLYAADTEGLQAFYAAYGEYLWSSTTGATFYAGPAVVNGTVYVPGNGTLYALSPNSGTAYKHIIHAPHAAELHPDFSLRVTPE